MKQRNRTGIVRHVAGVAALAVLAVGCSGSSDGAEPAVTEPLEEPEVLPVSEAPTTAAPVVTEAPVEEPALDASAIPELPCAEYVAESGFPLKPCDSGVLVETLQRDLESLFPEIAIDGLFGSQTFGFIEEFQRSNGLEETGLVSEELAGQIASAEALGELGDAESEPDADADADAGDTEAGDADAEGEAGAGDDAITEELCNELIGNADDPNFTAESIEACSDLGIDIVGEG